MRNTDLRRWTVFNPTTAGRWSRALRAGVAVLGVGMVIGAHAAHAQDSDDDDDTTFEQKIIKNIMGGIGAVGPNDRGIDYRERSPLVIPPKIDLPPPQSASAQPPAPNWPKDVDEAERKRIREAEKNRVRGEDSARPLMPSELAAARTKRVTPTEPLQPGTTQNPMLSPSQLGFKGKLFGTLFGQKTESAPFTGEPEREMLTQPPPGYQTPSSNFAYGTGPKQPLSQQGVYDVQSGKEMK